MASTWSALKVELLGTGENSGTWGTLTNVNLGDAVLGEAITGSATVDFATDADVTVTLTDSAASQSARNLRLNITESSTGVGSVRSLILGSGCQIEKFYLINNTGTGAKTVKNTSGTGISVPGGKATLVYNNGTNVVDAASYFTSLTLGSALPVASGGTGLTAGTSGGVPAYTASGTLASSAALTQYGVVYGGGAGAVPVATAAGTTGQILTATTGGAPSWAAPATSGTVTAVSVVSANGFAGTSSGGATPALTLTTSVTGVLKGNGTAISAAVAGTDYVAVNGALGTPSSGTLTNTTGLPLTSGVTGTLPIANGGTGTTSTTFANLTTNVTGTLPVANGGSGAVTLTGVLKGNGTSAFTAATAGTDYVAPGTATTFTALQTFNGTSSNASHKATNMLEVATVSATAATGTIAYDVTTQSVLYYTTNASGNFTVNFRGSSGTTLNTVMATGESLSATFLVTNGATAYYNSAVQVDGSSVTPKWQGGTAPTSGNASSIDSYTYVIIKTGSAAFTVLASVTKFA